MDIENEGLDLLLSAVRHPAFDGNPIAAQLFLGFSQEWAARQAGETGPEIEPLKFAGANDKEVKAVAGLFYGFSKCEEVKAYWKTLAVCLAILKVCVDELELRSTKGAMFQ